MSLILAQGAEHTNPAKLRSIVLGMQAQKLSLWNCKHLTNPNRNKWIDYICTTYGVSISLFKDVPVFDCVDYIAEEKYDGFSYLCDEGRFFSKSLSTAKGHVGDVVEKTGHVPHLSSIFEHYYREWGCDVHGELYRPGGISDDVTTIMGCGPEKAIKRQTESDFLHYRLFDIRQFKGKSIINEPYFIRRAILTMIYNLIQREMKMARYVELAPILDDPCMDFTRIVVAGGEGIIMKRTNALYIPGKKPANNWVKGKKMITLDVIIIGFNDGTGKNASLFGSFQFGVYEDDKIKNVGNCSSGLSDEIRNRIAKDPDSFIGTVVEIDAIQASKSSFRNAVFRRLRDDKGPKECTLDSVQIKKDLI